MLNVGKTLKFVKREKFMDGCSTQNLAHLGYLYDFICGVTLLINMWLPTRDNFIYISTISYYIYGATLFHRNFHQANLEYSTAQLQYNE